MVTAFLDNLIALALAAGREILAVREAGFDTAKKLDGTHVTGADDRAEAMIEQGLARLDANTPMIGEEAVAAGRIPEVGARFFCVDPLDGTRGFIRGADDFTVNIALVEGGAPTIGVVYAPATGELYAGEPGRAVAGRFDARTGAAINPLCPIRANPDAPRQWRVIASHHSGRNQTTNAFISALDARVEHANSSIKFCRLAEGAADLYPRFGEISEWDIAAGHAVLRAAGGEIMQPNGAPMRYGAREDGFLVRGFIAYASESARQAALTAMG